MSRPVTVADLAALAKKDYGRIDADVGPKSKVFSGALASGIGAGATPLGPVGAVFGGVAGYRHQRDANKLRRKLGGSPVNTPDNIKSFGDRTQRVVGGLTHSGIKGALVGAAGATVGAGVGALVGRRNPMLAARVGAAVGAIPGAVTNYKIGSRKVRDSQIWRKDFEKAEEAETKIETPVEEAPVAKAEPIDPAVALTKALEVYPMGIERSNALTRLSHAVTEILTHKEMIEQLPKEDLAKAADEWARGDDLRKAAWSAFIPE